MIFLTHTKGEDPAKSKRGVFSPKYFKAPKIQQKKHQKSFRSGSQGWSHLPIVKTGDELSASGKDWTGRQGAICLVGGPECRYFTIQTLVGPAVNETCCPIYCYLQIIETCDHHVWQQARRSLPAPTSFVILRCVSKRKVILENVRTCHKSFGNTSLSSCHTLHQPTKMCSYIEIAAMSCLPPKTEGFQSCTSKTTHMKSPFTFSKVIL